MVIISIPPIKSYLYIYFYYFVLNLFGHYHFHHRSHFIIVSKEFQNIIQSNYLVPTVLESICVANITRNCENYFTETLIDNIFINRGTDLKSGLMYSLISDHYPVLQQKLFVIQIFMTNLLNQ